MVESLGVRAGLASQAMGAVVKTMKASSGDEPTASFELTLAQPEDDQDLRAVLAATPMPGRVSLCFGREPNYFAGAAVEGRFRQTIVVRDRQRNGRVIGMGSRSISPVYLNGHIAPAGYLGGLRTLPEYRGGTLLARGYRYLRRLHEDGKTSLYVTTIAEGNREALATLTSGRAGLPKYHAAGQYYTLLLPRRRGLSRMHSAGIEVRAASAADLPQLVAFWNEVGPRRQFFPVLTEQDFGKPDSLYPDLQPAQILVAWREDRPCGTLALWNQRSFRQTVVAGLPTWLRLVRPMYNLLAAARNHPPLPAIGSAVSYLTAALTVIDRDDHDVLRRLLALATSLAIFPEERYLALGLHGDDPLLSVVRPQRALRYITRVFLACWEDGDPLRQSLDQRPLYLELGRL